MDKGLQIDVRKCTTLKGLLFVFDETLEERLWHGLNTDISYEQRYLKSRTNRSDLPKAQPKSSCSKTSVVYHPCSHTKEDFARTGNAAVFLL